MNMATKPKDDQLHISKLKEIVSNHLNKGYRVIIGRVYDLDSELRPWSGLSTMGWSREKIQSMLSEFCNRELTRINDVKFRELYLCDKGTAEH